MQDHTTNETQLEFQFTKLCECGCGKPAPLSKINHAKRGYVKGQPVRFICGHHGRGISKPNHKRRPLSERFWEKVDKRGPDECWEWQAHTSKSGYGTFQIGDRPYRANRVAYELQNGPIPEGMLVCHNCPDGDNPLCVNPSHLWLGTNKENTADMFAKGRAHDHSGERYYNAKFTNAQVREMRKLFADKKYRIFELALMNHVSPATMRAILLRKTYKNA